jgi:23S rRNA maturation mini-RNase III
MTDIQFNQEEEQILKLGLNYTYERPLKHFLQHLIIDTENAIKHLRENEQNAYRLLAYKKIKQIHNNTTTNVLHKRQNYITKQIRNKLTQNNLVVVKADKGNTIVIINKDTYAQKIEDFLKENQFTYLQKDPTEKFQKQLQQIIPKCNDIIDKQQKKYLIQIKPRPPTLKAQIKTHKENEPIRPVVNNIQAPTYRLAKLNTNYRS